MINQKNSTKLSSIRQKSCKDCSNVQWFFSLLFVTDDKEQKQSQKVLGELENIDDDCDRNDIAFVKIDDDKEAAEWGIDEIPTIVSFMI